MSDFPPPLGSVATPSEIADHEAAVRREILEAFRIPRELYGRMQPIALGVEAERAIARRAFEILWWGR